MGARAEIICALGLLALPVVASAIPVQSGIGTFVTARDCVGPQGDCSVLSAIQYSEYGGVPGELSAQANFTIPGYGTAAAGASFSGEIGAPILRLYTSSAAGGRVSTNTFALQRYTYTGLSATTRTFGGLLDYVQSITDPNNASYGTLASGIYAELSVFSSLAEFVETGPTAQTNNDNLLDFAFGAATGYELLGTDWFQDLASSSAGSASLGVTINLNPGDSVWVMAFLQTPAAGGSYVDAMNTFVTSWDDSTDLIPANVTVSVPEPGMLALFSLGLLGVFMRNRRDSLSRILSPS